MLFVFTTVLFPSSRETDWTIEHVNKDSVDLTREESVSWRSGALMARVWVLCDYGDPEHVTCRMFVNVKGRRLQPSFRDVNLVTSSGVRKYVGGQVDLTS